MDKKKKQLIGIIAAAVVVIILIIVFFGKGSNVSTSKLNIATLNEKEKYAMFEAEFACRMMESMQEKGELSGTEFVQETLQIIDELNEKYGYTLSEIEANKLKYENDQEFQTMARDYAFEICPKVTSTLSSDLDY